MTNNLIREGNYLIQCDSIQLKDKNRVLIYSLSITSYFKTFSYRFAINNRNKLERWREKIEKIVQMVKYLLKKLLIKQINLNNNTKLSFASPSLHFKSFYFEF